METQMTFISGQLWRSINLQRIKVYHCFITVYKEWKDQRKDQIIEQRRSDNSPHHFRNWNKVIHIKNYVGGGSTWQDSHNTWSKCILSKIIHLSQT